MSDQQKPQTPAEEEFAVSSDSLKSILGLAPRINGTHTIQSTLVPISFLNVEEEDRVEPGPYFRLLVAGDPEGSCNVFADLSYNTDRTIISTAIALVVEFDNPERKGIQTEDEGQALGEWITHVAYDIAASTLRQLVTNNTATSDLELPLLPLKPSIQVHIKDLGREAG